MTWRPRKKGTRKRCKHCKKQFTAYKTTTKFCCDACRASYNRKSKINPQQDEITKLKRQLNQTGFFSWLISQCRRCNTVEIIPKSLNELTELYEIYVYKNKANAYRVKDRVYETSHIYPVNGQNEIGTLHPKNLCIQPVEFNRKHSTKHYGNGHSISKLKLKPEYTFDDDATRADILDLIFKRVPITTLKEFKRICKPATLAYNKELKWFNTKICLLDDIDINELTLEELLELKESLTNKKPFNLNFTPYDEDIVLIREIKRLGKYYPELKKVLYWTAKHFKEVSKDWMNDSPEDDANVAFIRAATACFQHNLVGKPIDLVMVEEETRKVFSEAYENSSIEKAIREMNYVIHSLDSARLFAEVEAEMNYIRNPLTGIYTQGTTL